MREAQKRGLSIEQCRRILGFSPLNSPLSGAAQDEVCRKALNPVRTSWDNNATFANYVQEAQRRGLSIDQCRRLLGFVAQGTQGQQQAPDDELCRSALSGDKTQWDSTAAYSVRVQEARNRGFTVEKCRSILGISSPPPPQLVSASSQLIGWSTKFNSNQIYIDPDVQDRVGDSGYSYETQFYSNDGRIPKTDFVMFVLSRGNIAQKHLCAYASPQKYFESVLSNRRDKVNTLYPGENQDFKWANVSSFGFRTGNKVRLLYVRDFILMSKTNPNFLIHVGGRFAQSALRVF